MGRLRTQKGVKHSHADSPVKLNDSNLKSFAKTTVSDSDRKSKPKKKADVLKEQVLALGGDADDLDLVKDIQESDLIAVETQEDPALSKDVSKFLKGLSITGEKHTNQEHNSALIDKRLKAKQKQNADPSSAISLVSSPPMDLKPANSKLIVSPTAQWYTAVPPLPTPPTPLPSITPDSLASLTSRAASLHSAAVAAYNSSSSSTSSAADASFLQQILSGGTLADRLSALTLLAQGSPLHNIRALEALRTMAERGRGVGGRGEALKALRCVVDWWVGGGAPDRKLRYFRDQPLLLHPGVTDAHLVVWYFEDWLKKYFFSILQILETLSLDPLPYVRTQSLALIAGLLSAKPEQEQNLLRLLVNKLGDTEKALCARVSYHLLHLLQAHPAMKGVIVREVVALVLRPLPPPIQPTTSNKHIRFADDAPKPKPTPKKAEGNVHARYYATITLNQIVLSPSAGDRAVAVQLLDVYFAMFREMLGEGETEKKVTDTGPKEVEELKDKSKGKGKAYAKVKGGKSREVKGAAGFAEVESAQSRLISAVLTGVNRALPFAKLGAGDAGLDKHLDTLFLITHTATFNVSLQALVLIQHICGVLPPTAPAISRYNRALYASLHDARLASSSKQAMYLNLLFKSLKADTDASRVCAFVRRFVQMLATGSAAEFVAGGLYLLGELFNTVPGLREMITVPPLLTQPEEEVYDPRKRDPQFAHASASPLWELTPLLHHYHPAVALHAAQLLAGKPITASADLALNTLAHFLDRFVYKNPKRPKPKGASAMQPAAASVGGGSVRLLKGEVGEEGTVNDERWWGKMKEGDVPADQVFFHKFFSKKNEREKARAKKAEKRKEKGDDESGSDESGEDPKEGSGPSDVEEDSDIEEAEIWKAMKATMPKADGDEALMEESDDIPSDLDEDEDEDAETQKDDADADQGSDDGSEEEDGDEDDVLSLAEGSDNEDLVDLDADIPSGLIDYDGSDVSSHEEGEQWGGISGDTSSGKRKRMGDKDDKRSIKKKLRSLPTFASYEDYAKMIEDGPEDDI